MTIRLRGGLRSLRQEQEYSAVLQAFEGGRRRAGFRLVHYSVQSNHLRLIVEAPNRRRLSRGMQGLLIRVAKKLNRVWGRTGSVFADRYHEHILCAPREAWNAIAYVLNNARKHGLQLTSNLPDPFSSGRWFAGWRERPPDDHTTYMPISAACSWLLTKGFLKHGPIPLLTTPGR